MRLVEILKAPPEVDPSPPTHAEALVRMAEAEDTLRAIAAGEVDAFVVSDGGPARRVFTLATADRPYRIFVENMQDGAATLSSSGLILYANRRLAELLSTSRERVVGSPLATFLVSGAHLTRDEIRGPDGRGATMEVDLIGGNGRGVPVLFKTSPLELDGDQLTCLTVTDLSAQKAQDREIERLSHAQAGRLTDLQTAQEALIQQATHDALTGLPNRSLLMDRIGQALSHAKRSGGCTAVLFFDLDRFKQVNDTRGHAAGDAVLQGVAERLRRAVRPMDTVARIGGDEFVVVAVDIDTHLQAVDISTRLAADLCRLRSPVGDDEPIAASVGISVSVAGAGTAESMLNEADTAMYQAKSVGGGRSEIYDANLGHQVRQRSAARQMLQSALDDRRVIVHYQPVIELTTGLVTGFEALARITDLDGAILAPTAFIPVAEESGLVVPLGEQVLEMACREASRWQGPQTPDRRLTVAVNLSSRQFERGDLATVVQERLEETNLDPRCLHLELTETVIIDLRPDVLKQLGRIRDLGVQIGLDDFGTGYASLTHLRRLPLSFVKIDRSFVQGLETDLGDQQIVSALVELAANLGLRSIAEGVEAGGQLARLRALGCDYAQGFLFARPLPPDALVTAVQHAAW